MMKTQTSLTHTYIVKQVAALLNYGEPQILGTFQEYLIE